MGELTILQALETAFVVLLVGAAVAALVAKNRGACGAVSVVFNAIASALMVAAAVGVWTGGAVEGWIAGTRIQMLGAELTLRVDALSALFLMILAVISLCTTLYSAAYMSRYPEESLRRFFPIVLVFQAAVMGIVVVSDLFYFFVFWEAMTLSSWALVIFRRRDPAALRAGFKYFLITHIATAGMFGAALAVWQSSGSFSFDAMRETLGDFAVTRPVLLHVVLALFFFGFGTKAGMLPFGDWLPDAYPEAPSGAAALFGGTMTKLGIYGLLRVLVMMMPEAPILTAQVWGVIIAAFGAVSMFLGTITSLSQDDAKRLIAFNHIGQIGYVLLAIGVGVYFLPIDPLLAGLGLVAAAFHMLNHACYKSLLFMTAGSALYRTGERDLNKIGGLAQIMPITALAAVVASLSIAGLPPFNGFASKWMIFQASIFGGLEFPVFIVLGAVALFISVVTLAAFIKYVATAFLGKLAVGSASPEAGEVPSAMYLPQAFLAFICIAIGLLPALALRVVVPAVQAAAPAWTSLPSADALVGPSWFGLAVYPEAGGILAGVWNPLLLLGALVVCGLISYVIFRAGGAPVREVATWYCGEEHADELVRYRAHGYYAPFKEAFRNVYPHVPVPRPKMPEWVRRACQLDQWLYQPFIRFGTRVTERLSRTHSGIPQTYMLWQVVGMILVIALLFWLRK